LFLIRLWNLKPTASHPAIIPFFVRKLPFLFIVLLLQLDKIEAQPRGIDKNIVMDFFQNMAYDDAIHYLLDAEKTDSLNIQILGYLGYAYHMNDDVSNAGRYYQKMLNVDSGK
jgi:hypothetical protein